MENTELVLLILIITIIATIISILIYYYVNHKKHKDGFPDHIDLYFQEHFSHIASEWDLMSHESANKWRHSMLGRLTVVGNEIDTLKHGRNEIDARIVRLERELSLVEERN